MSFGVDGGRSTVLIIAGHLDVDPSERDAYVAGCTAVLIDQNPGPVYQNVNAACFNTSRDDELQLTNAGSFDSHIA